MAWSPGGKGCPPGPAPVGSLGCVRPASAAAARRARARRRRTPASAPCGTGPSAGARPDAVSCRCSACGSSSASLVSYIGACGTSRRCSRAHQSSRVRRLKLSPSSSISASWWAMRCSRVAKRGSWNSSGCSIALARPCQNFSGEDMCSAIHLPSAHSQHVGLRHARPAVRAHHLVGLEEVREGVEVEVRHRLQHRDLDACGRCRCVLRSNSAPSTP